MNLRCSRRATWLCRASTALLGLILVSEFGWAAASNEPEWLAAAVKGLEKVESRHRNLSVEVTKHTQMNLLNEPPGERLLSIRYVWKTCDQCMKTSQFDNKSPKSLGDVVANNSYFFAVGSAQGKPRAMLDVGSREELQFEEKQPRRSVHALFNDRFYAHVTIGHFGDRFSDLLRKNAESLRAQKVDLNGRQVLELTGDFEAVLHPTAALKSYVLTESKMLLDPAASYQIVRWEHQLPRFPSVKRVYEAEYVAAGDGILVLAKFVETYMNPEKGSQIEDFTYANWEFDKNTPDEFTASYYALPEPPADPSFFSRRVRLLLIGVFCAVIGTWIYGRFKTKPAEPPGKSGSTL